MNIFSQRRILIFTFIYFVDLYAIGQPTLVNKTYVFFFYFHLVVCLLVSDLKCLMISNGNILLGPLRSSGTVFFTFPNMSIFRIKNVPKKNWGKLEFWDLFWYSYRVFTMASENDDFQIHLYEKPYIPFERSQKVI